MGEVTTHQPGAPVWTELSTTDLEGTKRFYTEVLGWDYTSDDGVYHTSRVRGHDVAGVYGDPGGSNAWVTYLATENVDAAARRVTDNGGRIVAGPEDAGEWGRYALATDNAGVVFGLWQERKHAGGTLVDEPGAVVWNQLNTPNLPAARDFYTGVLAYTWEATDTGQDGPEYSTFLAGGELAGGAMEDPAGPPQWLVHFGVPDADAATATAQRLGAKIVEAPTDSPYGRFAVLEDPQGARFAVVSTPENG